MCVCGRLSLLPDSVISDHYRSNIAAEDRSDLWLRSSTCVYLFLHGFVKELIRAIPRAPQPMHEVELVENLRAADAFGVTHRGVLPLFLPSSLIPFLVFRYCFVFVSRAILHLLSETLSLLAQ